MKLKNVLIVVDDIEQAKKFYQELFGLVVVCENEANVVLTEGLVLQDKKVWQDVLAKDIVAENNASLIYFEEYDIEAFAEKLEKSYPRITYLNRLAELDGGQKMLRFYDLDGNLLEVRTPLF